MYEKRALTKSTPKKGVAQGGTLNLFLIVVEFNPKIVIEVRTRITSITRTYIDRPESCKN